MFLYHHWLPYHHLRDILEGKVSLTWCWSLRLIYIWPKVHRKPRDEVVVLDPAKHLVGFEHGIFRFICNTSPLPTRSLFRNVVGWLSSVVFLFEWLAFSNSSYCVTWLPILTIFNNFYVLYLGVTVRWFVINFCSRYTI